MINRHFFEKYKLPIILICIDLILTIIYISTRGHVLLFNLDTENNIPTIYQTIKLLLLSFFLYIFTKDFINQKTSLLKKIALYTFPLAFLFLALDEMGQIHENLKPQLVQIFPFIDNIYVFARDLGYNSADWVLLYSPLILLFGFIAIYYVKTVYRTLTKNMIIVLMISFLILFSVPFIELYNTSTGFDSLTKLLWLSYEELSEMIAISLLLVVFYKEGNLKYEIKDNYAKRNINLKQLRS
jgi:hypothetical protein